MCFTLGDVSYPKPDNSGGGSRQIEELVYVKDVDKQIIREAAII